MPWDHYRVAAPRRMPSTTLILVEVTTVDGDIGLEIAALIPGWTSSHSMQWVSETTAIVVVMLAGF